MKRITIISILGAAILLAVVPDKRAAARSESNAARHQAVVLNEQEYYTSQQLSSNVWATGYAGMQVYNCSSSRGAPTFPAGASVYVSGCFTNEFGQVQWGYSTNTTQPVQIAEAIAQLLDEGFRIVSIHTPSEQNGIGPTKYVFVKP